MSRLNKATREAIINKAIEKSGVLAREDALISRRAKLANDVRLFAIGGEGKEREIMDKFEKAKEILGSIGDSLFNTSVIQPNRDDKVYVNFQGLAVNLQFSGFESRARPLVYKPLVSCNSANRTVIKSDNPLYAEFDAIQLEQKAVSNLRAHVKAEVSAMVNSVTTIKKLLEIWPEAKELLPPKDRVQSTAIVANIGNLNTIIGLPSGD